jgi:hypothetical protein
MIRRDKARWIEERAEEINLFDRTGQSDKLYKAIRDAGKKKQRDPNQMIRAQGGEVVRGTEALRTWEEYIGELYRGRDGPSIHNLDTALGREDLEPAPLLCEVKEAIDKIKKGKAPGLDDIPIELWQCGGEESTRVLHRLVCKVWELGKWPEDWTKQEMVPLFKKGSRLDCGNYRTIALISHTSKILLKIILNRLGPVLRDDIPEEQMGFKKGIGCRDLIVGMQNVLDKMSFRKSGLILVFIDYEKAFDCVSHGRLFDIMIKRGYPKHLVQLIYSLYSNSVAAVRWDDERTGEIRLTRGSRQGCIMSPSLFSIYGEEITDVADEQGEGIVIGGRKVNNLKFADDTTILARSARAAEIHLEAIQNAALELGLKINERKTKVMKEGGGV